MSTEQDAPPLDVDDATLAHQAGYFDDGAPSPNGDAPLSLLDQLRADRAEIAEEHTLDIVIPGWHRRLGLRLGPITTRQIGAMLDRVKRGSTSEQLGAATDTLVAATRCVLIRADASDAFEPVTVDGVEIGLEAKLTDALGLGANITTARGVLFALYAGANAPDVAIQAANADYSDWAREASDDVDEEFRGE
jgi:hypothetical protein